VKTSTGEIDKNKDGITRLGLEKKNQGFDVQTVYQAEWFYSIKFFPIQAISIQGIQFA